MEDANMYDPEDDDFNPAGDLDWTESDAHNEDYDEIREWTDEEDIEGLIDSYTNEGDRE